MKEYILPPLDAEPEIVADAVHTWKIEEWRNLEKKEHGPVFTAGGSPW
jgi:ubiquitin carboxyl-terminal hydrolase 7